MRQEWYGIKKTDMKAKPEYAEKPVILQQKVRCHKEKVLMPT